MKPYTYSLNDIIQADLNKYKDIHMPLKASPIEQYLIKKLYPYRLHVNPEDDFASEKIGPSRTIINNYVNQMRIFPLGKKGCFEPLIVEKMYPDGYLIINGHHRWAAALQLGKKVPVKIVNLTHESDLDQMLSRAENSRRAAFDLDEVIFCKNAAEAEKPLPFPLNLFYKERIRRGVPGLFNALKKRGYDVWVYTSGGYSMDHIDRLLKKYHVQVTGVVSGGKKIVGNSPLSAEASQRLARQYHSALHIDAEAVLYSEGETKTFRHIPLSASGAEWVQEVLAAVDQLDAGENGTEGAAER